MTLPDIPDNVFHLAIRNSTVAFFVVVNTTVQIDDKVSRIELLFAQGLEKIIAEIKIIYGLSVVCWGTGQRNCWRLKNVDPGRAARIKRPSNC